MAVSRTNPHGLGPRGLRLFKSIAASSKLAEPELVNLVEACRIADRLEQLNDLITGNEDAWLRLKLPRDDDGVVEVLVNDTMKEARLHAASLRALLAPFTAAADADETPGEVPSNVASIKQALKSGGATARPKRSAK